MFPINSIINLFRTKDRKKVSQNIQLISKPIGDEEESAVREKNRVYENSERNVPALGLRIKCLSKTFKKMCSKTELKALNELTL